MAQTHIWPVPDFCVTTQTFPQHEAWAREHGACSRPGPNCSSWYYGGIDLAPPYARRNEDILVTASANGSVRWENQGDTGYGLVVYQMTDVNDLVVYAHLDTVMCEGGTYVQQGHLIGYMGDTGNSSGKHLHWEIRRGGIPIDPLRLMVDQGTEPVPPPVEPDPAPVFKLPDKVVYPIAKVVPGISALRIRAEPVNGATLGWLKAGYEVAVLDYVYRGDDVWFLMRPITGLRVGWAAAFYGGEAWIELQ